MSVRKFLDISTAHLTEDMRTQLNCLQLGEGNIAEGFLGGAVFYPITYGGLMWVPDDPKESALGHEEGVPEILLNIQLYARSLGCDYVLFDADAEMVDELPVFEEVA